MYADEKILIGCNENTCVSLLPKLANRHGLIAGATGTGKTITLKTLAESFSDLGVPVFLADMKGDISGLAKIGSETEKIKTNVDKYGLAEKGFKYQAYPVEFWDLFGQKGLPVRVTLSEMGPTLLAKILNLSEAQTGVLNIVFRVADNNSLPIIDLKDLKAMINHVVENKAQYESEYGAIAEKSANTILRSLITLEDQGGNDFFFEPSLDLNDFIKVDENGKGIINILDAQKLSLSPELYSTFLLWMLSELFENLPEVGDMDKPKFVFFFDEAHLLFDDMSPEFGKKIEQIVRLIRSKGVGLYFISQSPADIPDDILAQLGNRVQHALHAYTPKDQKAVKVAAETFRPNPDFSTEDVISELGIGQALVSVLDENGVPGIVEKVDIVPPQSYIGAIDDAMREELINLSELKGKYFEPVDPESAYELLLNKIESDSNLESEVVPETKEAVEEAIEQNHEESVEEAPAQETPEEKPAFGLGDILGTVMGGGQPAKGKKTKKSQTQKMAERAASQAANTVAREVTKGIMRGIFGQMKWVVIMAHPHKKAVANMPASSLIGIIEESKMTYVRENLSIFLHESQIKLLKQVKKHEKLHHKRIRVKQFEKAKKDDLFNMHLGLYLKKYQKLEKIGLIEIDLNPDNGLEYDCALTSKGKDVLDEISALEKEWESVVNISDDDLEVLRKLALDSFEISYRHKKKKGFIF